MSGNGTCETCPAGYECPISTDPPVICDEEKYRYNARHLTIAVPSVLFHQWWLWEKQVKNCQRGTRSFFCLSTNASLSSNLVIWQLALFNIFSGPGQVTCYTCAFGTYKNISGNGTCETCPAGYKCPTVTDLPIICEAGEYRYKTETNNYLYWNFS